MHESSLHFTYGSYGFQVLKAEVDLASAAAPSKVHSFTKVLLFGEDQPMGARLLKELVARVNIFLNPL